MWSLQKNQKWENMIQNETRFQLRTTARYITPTTLPKEDLTNGGNGTHWCVGCKKFFCFCGTSISMHTPIIWKRNITQSDLICHEDFPNS